MAFFPQVDRSILQTLLFDKDKIQRNFLFETQVEFPMLRTYALCSEGLRLATDIAMITTSITWSSYSCSSDYDDIRACVKTMLKLSPVEALDYAAALEDAAEELHILGKLVPPHYQYTESADEVRSMDFEN
jgi:hypothetical protein